MVGGEAQAETQDDAGAPPLSIRDLGVRLHQRDQVVHALRGVDFDVARGEIVALVGESGSGKSTLSLAVQGLLSASARPEVTGSVLVDGTEIVGAPDSTLRRVRRERVRSIFQDPMTSLNPTMRVGRQLAEAARDDRPPEEWLERVGIAQPARRVSAYPHELSGGERQRVMIAMAMSGKPVLVLADEPTTALDVTVQAQILELIRELRRDSGTAFVFVTHDLAVATTVADRIAVIYGGRIVESGCRRAGHRQPRAPLQRGAARGALRARRRQGPPAPDAAWRPRVGDADRGRLLVRPALPARARRLPVHPAAARARPPARRAGRVPALRRGHPRAVAADREPVVARARRAAGADRRDREPAPRPSRCAAAASRARSWRSTASTSRCARARPWRSSARAARASRRS